VVEGEMAELERYIRMFEGVRRAPGPMWGAATQGRAPHKPLLLLAVLDLAARGALPAPFLDIGGDLVELNELFTGYWRRVVPAGRTSSIAFPFSRLHNEPFWELVTLPGRTIDAAAVNNVSTVVQLRALAAGARMDAELHLLMQGAEARAALRAALLAAHFDAAGAAALEARIAENAGAFTYSRELLVRAQRPVVREPDAGEEYPKAVRDQGFRRAVVTCYNHRCALCGVRIVTPEGRTAVDAAHIVPWAESHDDDIRNGMALCKLCHWAFDEGQLGVGGDYTVLAARTIGAAANVPGFLLTLAGRGIIPPADRALWPAQENLGRHWHRFGLN